jgi:hypothetical protein
MDGEARGFVHEAELRLDPGADERAPGGAVTVALCGDWDHEGACRWPHNSAIVADGDRWRLRTVFLAPLAEEGEVRHRIDRGLRQTGEWTVVSAAGRALTSDEEALAQTPAAPG